MTHSHTTKNGSKRYRYYVCMNAQKRGWHNCPSKSIPAAEVEQFVVDQIKAVAGNPGLVTDTLAQVRQQAEGSLRTLESERQSIDRDLIATNKEISTVAIEAASAEDDSPTTRRLADLQERVQSGERRLTEIREESLRLRAGLVGEDDVAKALGEFDTLWQSLSPREQARVLHLLIERVDYDGEDGTVSVTFRPTGIRELAEEEAA